MEEIRQICRCKVVDGLAWFCKWKYADLVKLLMYDWNDTHTHNLMFNFRKTEVNQDFISDEQLIREEGGSVELDLLNW